MSGAAPCATAASTGAAREGSASAAPAPDDLRVQIGALKEQAMALKMEKTKVNKALRNAEKKRSRLKRKARELTDSDLMQVLKMRETENAERGGAAGSSGDAGPGGRLGIGAQGFGRTRASGKVADK